MQVPGEGCPRGVGLKVLMDTRGRGCRTYPRIEHVFHTSGLFRPATSARRVQQHKNKAQRTKDERRLLIYTLKAKPETLNPKPLNP